MIFLVVSEKKEYRIQQIISITKNLEDNEVLIFDDTKTELVDLEQYIYPSLFSVAPPIIQLKYILKNDDKNISETFLKKLLSSPTVFIFEEMFLGKPLVNLFKKCGSVICLEEKKPALKKRENNFSSITQILTAIDKKSRWLLYQKALREEPIEAIVGILYWKARELASRKGMGQNKYRKLYQDLISAHARAWQKKVPLELMIEKVILNS